MVSSYDPGADKAAYDRYVLHRLGEGGRRFRSTADAKPREGLSPDQMPADDPAVSEMRQNRRVTRQASAGRRTAGSGNWGGSGGSGGGGGLDLQFATGRPRDPLFYWRQNNLPYDFADNEELEKVRSFCNTPDAPVWMGDFSFKPIGEIQPGEEVIGWTWSKGAKGGSRKKLVRTRVLAAKRRWAPRVVLITMRSGRTLKCTPDHMWANARYSPNYRGQYGADHSSGRQCWQQPEFIPAVTKAKNARYVRIVDPTPPLAEDQRRAADWLSGVYDGEGCGERIAQDSVHNPEVRKRIMDYLDALDLPWTETYDCVNIRIPGARGGSGSHQNLVNFLNWTDPVRRVSRQIDKRLLCRPSAGYDEVESVESIGGGWVVSMQTETGNYTAWGFASKNCRLLYQTDPIIGSCVDIFSKLPISGLSLQCKNPRLQEFYEELFFSDEGLDYEEFFVDMGREYFTVGEAWPFATFNENLGIWDDEELLAPEDIKAERSPFLKEPRYFIRLPQSIREVLRTRRPVWEYERLVQAYPELIAYTSDNSFMPVSSVLLRQLKFKGDTFNIRGIPLLTRAMRSVLQQEMLNSALDSIADRMYTPLVLFKLGASASDLGTDVPWIPTEDDLGDFQEATDAALAADFRAIFYNFAVTTELVFGREQMPDLTADFERIEDRMLQTFGLSRTFLTGASSGQTYAADALNKELLSQLMTRYQKILRRHYRQRALVVAEAQGHYDYDLRAGKKYVRIEEILETNEETGEQEIVEQPKLLIPDVVFPVMDFRNEDTVRQLIEALHEGGVPVSRRTRMRGLPLDLDEEAEAVQEESVQMAVMEQQTRKMTYQRLRDQGLPVPADLVTDFRALPLQLQPPPSAPMMRTPQLGTDPAQGDMTPNMDPTQEDLAEVPPDQPPPGAPPEDEGDGGIPQVPEESSEQRQGMPTAASLFRRSAGARAYARANPVVSVRYYETPGEPGDGETPVPVPHLAYATDEDIPYETDNAEPVGVWATPSHVGRRRRYASVSRGDELPDYDDAPDPG